MLGGRYGLQTCASGVTAALPEARSGRGEDGVIATATVRSYHVFSVFFCFGASASVVHGGANTLQGIVANMFIARRLLHPTRKHKRSILC